MKNLIFFKTKHLVVIFLVLLFSCENDNDFNEENSPSTFDIRVVDKSSKLKVAKPLSFKYDAEICLLNTDGEPVVRTSSSTSFNISFKNIPNGTYKITQSNIYDKNKNKKLCIR